MRNKRKLFSPSSEHHHCCSLRIHTHVFCVSAVRTDVASLFDKYTGNGRRRRRRCQRAKLPATTVDVLSAGILATTTTHTPRYEYACASERNNFSGGNAHTHGAVVSLGSAHACVSRPPRNRAVGRAGGRRGGAGSNARSKCILMCANKHYGVCAVPNEAAMRARERVCERGAPMNCVM